jgi:hypothetical protein
MTTQEVDAVVNTHTNGAHAFAAGFTLGYLRAQSLEPDMELLARVWAIPPQPNTVEGRAALPLPL